MLRCGADLFTEDGVLIQAEGETRTIKAVWTVLVVINPPHTLPMQVWVDRVQRGITAAGSHVSAGDKLAWESRLSTLLLEGSLGVEERLHDIPTAGRPRRGLVDAIGSLSKFLFGVSTIGDVAALRDIVEKARYNNDVLSHDVQRLVTVANQTRRLVRENRMDLRRLRQHEGALLSQLNRQGEKLSLLEHRVNSLSISRIIDRSINELELVSRGHQLQLASFFVQKRELERGWLTESILSPTELSVVLRTIRLRGFATPIPEWYFENSRVEPLWVNDRQLVFRSKLVGLSRKTYLQFSLNYFPVGMGSQHLRQVRGRGKVAIDTISGAVFWPIECSGKNPRVCLQGKEELKPTCESNLITNRTSGLCQLAITKRGERLSEVYALRDDRVVVVSYAVLSVFLRCSGKAAKERTVDGPSLVHLPGGCELGTKDWNIRGIEQGQHSLNKTFEIIQSFKSLNFSFPKHTKLKALEALNWTDRVEVPLLQVRDWEHQPLGFTRDHVRSALYVSGSVLSFCLLLLIVLVLLWCCNCWGLRKWAAGRAPTARPRHPVAPPEEPSEELALALASLTM